ncbi:MAG: carboxypeptidase regulatory-like domain-containing protein, partial [Acidobacteria bacterium]|nr:carboxypeptidase regulatory-like domain-containing protein [Acidobacteriota bacterium]
MDGKSVQPGGRGTDLRSNRSFGGADVRKSLGFAALCWVAFACLYSPSSLAQQVAIAEVSGQVSDPNGAALAGATVKMTETDKSIVHTTASDASGNYLCPGLPVGRYRLEASKSGFKTYLLNDIVLAVNDHVSFNTRLQIGSVAETVEVASEAPLVETENAAISNVVESRQIVDLPLNGRYATQLVLLAGASLNAPGGDETGSKNFYSSQTISVAGGQANGTNYLLDGGDNNDTFSNVNLPFPFPDALEEFSVETSALPAR